MIADGPVLRDIHLPAAAWWPPAMGWWGLAGLVALLVGLSAWWLAERWPKRRLLRQALREVDRLEAAFADSGDAMALAAGASRLLRRIARCIEPSVVALDDGRWCAFLRRHAPDEACAAALERLLDVAYRPRVTVDAAALLRHLRSWCRRALRAGPPWRVRRRSERGGYRSAPA